jgi:FHS family Na+ dependent glucose MFS transporter 1
MPTTTTTPTTTTPTTTTPTTTTPIHITKKPTLTPTPTKKVTPKTKITPKHKEVPNPTATITEDHTTSNMSETSTIHILTTTAHKPKASVGDLLNSMIDSVKNMSRIQFAYSIVSLLLFVSSTLFLVLYCFTKRRRDPEETEDFNEISMHVENNSVRMVTLILSFFFFLCYVGMETTFGGLIMTFAVEYAHWTKPQGAIVTAIFWGSLAVGRGFAIFVSNCCKPQTMLSINLFFTIIGTLILAFGVQQLDILLWLGTVFLGIGLSSIFPTSVNWVEQYFKITGKSTAVFVTGSAIGQMVFPVVTGYFYQNYNKQYLMYIILCLSIVTVILYIIMQCLASKTSSIKSSNGFLRLDDLDPDMDNTDYNSTRDSERRKFMPVHNGYDLLLQDAEEEF